jgi:hypothetical protein
MSIHKIGSDLIRPSGPNGTRRGSGSSKQADTEELRRIERADRVDISAEGRELAAQLVEERNGLTKSRTAVIENRLEQGFYDDPPVAEKVAARLLASGDL